ncbi:MAG: hypothetical protein NW220_01120 [Leptolyngbyaceae cyanobacterium bins.349]|nr:hypothetical protein [Leptolyngbyaceae cyanobacterium bins.349]
MNLAKLAFCSYPVILTSFLMFGGPVKANVPIPQSQFTATALTASHPAIAIALISPSERPQIPTGCACARCAKPPEELLQGKLPTV